MSQIRDFGDPNSNTVLWIYHLHFIDSERFNVSGHAATEWSSWNGILVKSNSKLLYLITAHGKNHEA